MKKRSTVLTLVTGTLLSVFCFQAYAGNPQRNGQAGASELLIDPWAGTSGFAGANTSCAQGIEAQFLNVAGTAFTNHTEIILGNTDYLDHAGINIAVAGFSQHVGDAGVIGLSIMSMNFGTIPITTYDNPEGGLGTYNPQFLNIGLSFARAFSDNIYGGVNVKLISESIYNVSATGVAVDAGIQYVADVAHGKKNLHFGISLKNVGPQMSYSGDGLAFETAQPNNTATGSSGTMTVEQRSQGYELPSLVNIGAAYDFRIMKSTDSGSTGISVHRITIAGNFTANAFSEDEEQLGVEYGYKSYFSVRVGFDYQNGIFSELSTNPTNGGRLTAFTGPCAGFTLQLPFGKGKASSFGVSYAYRATYPYSGCHTIGIRM
ncbi:MAG TPA: PorV/PorQ family protein, partial [Bacteroidia bacterium]|nr:PorV/PorQ family protein [Bacteroidia bacterium]